MAESSRVILFSPIKQTPEILKLVLLSYSKIVTNKFSISYWFYDDNENVESTKLLDTFVSDRKNNSRILPKLDLPYVAYNRSELHHHWDKQLVDKIIEIKNYAIRCFLDSEAEYLFLIDSDICINPNLISHLISCDVAVVSECFWTQWSHGSPYMPNVWDYHSYGHKNAESIIRLMEPGLYNVGGLGACTLIKRSVFESGITFSRIASLDYWGEDRHFCVRAMCGGYNLFADTVFPPFHVFRMSQLAEARKWIEDGCSPSYFLSLLDDNWKKSIFGRFAQVQKKVRWYMKPRMWAYKMKRKILRKRTWV